MRQKKFFAKACIDFTFSSSEYVVQDCSSSSNPFSSSTIQSGAVYKRGTSNRVNTYSRGSSIKDVCTLLPIFNPLPPPVHACPLIAKKTPPTVHMGTELEDK